MIRKGQASFLISSFVFRKKPTQIIYVMFLLGWQLQLFLNDKL